MAQLVEDNRRLQATISKLRDTTSSQTARLEEELASKTRSVEILQEKLSAQSDYDEVKRELVLVYRFFSFFSLSVSFFFISVFTALQLCKQGIPMSICLSVCLSVKRVHCDKTNESSADILPYTKGQFV